MYVSEEDVDTTFYIKKIKYPFKEKLPAKDATYYVLVGTARLFDYYRCNKGAGFTFSLPNRRRLSKGFCIVSNRGKEWKQLTLIQLFRNSEWDKCWSETTGFSQNDLYIAEDWKVPPESFWSAMEINVYKKIWKEA
jgi:hypothetical protein